MVIWAVSIFVQILERKTSFFIEATGPAFWTIEMHVLEEDPLRSDGSLSLFLWAKTNKVKAGTSSNADHRLYLYCTSKPRTKQALTPKVCVTSLHMLRDPTTLEDGGYSGYVFKRCLPFSLYFTFYSGQYTNKPP